MGDPFAATLLSALLRCQPISEGLRWAAVNAMSVVQQVGSHKGLLDAAGLRRWMDVAPAACAVRPLLSEPDAARAGAG